MFVFAPSPAALLPPLRSLLSHLLAIPFARTCSEELVRRKGSSPSLSSVTSSQLLSADSHGVSYCLCVNCLRRPDIVEASQ